MLASIGTGQWVFLALAAVIAFWMVGAYNRLVAMRTSIGESFRHVDELVQRRAAAAQALALQARSVMASEAGAFDAWLQTQSTARQAADALRQRPVRADLAAALVSAEVALAATHARVMALLEQEASFGAHGSAATHRATLDETQARLLFARQVFNEAAQTYNQAASERPTRWLARLYGFEPAGQL